MSGGSSHQRRTAERIAKKFAEEIREQLSSSGLAVSSESPDFEPDPTNSDKSSHNTRPSSDWRRRLSPADTLGILGVLLGIFFLLVVPTVWYKAPALLLLCVGFVYLAWFSFITYGLSVRWRAAIGLLGLGFINLCVIPQLVAQWRLEHLKSEMTFSASFPNVYFEQKVVHGIPWQYRYAELHLDVTSDPRFPSQDFFLSVGSEDQTDLFEGMAQIGDEPSGCVPTRPLRRASSLHTLYGIKGGGWADLSRDINDIMNDAIPDRDHWNLTCINRINAGSKIYLVLAATTRNEISGVSSPPKALHVWGNYETSPVEGNKIVYFDAIVPVTTPPPRGR
jgi:hypothetical protein